MIEKVSILIWILLFYKFSLILGVKSCEFKLNLENDCSPTEYCDEETKECHCLKGYERFNSTSCIHSNKTDETDKNSNLIENGDSGSVTVYILTPLLLIIFVICAIYLNRKYHIATWVNNKMHRNIENYDEFMIGQDLDDDDDPPLH